MNTIDFIKMSLDTGKGWVGGLIADMKDAPMTAPTPNGGNHPLWVLGHLVYSEADLVQGLVQGKENPYAEWKDLFGMGSQPSDDPSKYPSFDELLTKFEEVRAETLAVVDSLTDDDLDKPSHAPDEMKDFFGTIGRCLMATCLHFMFHGGQVADARRADGRPPLMA